jgi:predicted porin
MKKLPLVIALGAASLCGVASAQSSVQVYGRLYPFLVSESGSGAAAAAAASGLSPAATGVNVLTSQTSMVSGNSNLGFRGTEDIGGGLKARFQIEGVVSVQNGQAGDGAGQVWDRNTFVGLDGDSFGSVKLGRMDTIFKNYGDTLGVLGVSSGTFMSSSNILRKPGFGTSSAARFHERAGNSIQYETPEVGGVQAGVQYVLDPAKTDTRNVKTLSLGIKYDNGPIYVALAHEIHDDAFGGSAQSPSGLRNSAVQTVNAKDKATQFTVEYRLGKAHKFEFDVIQKQYNENPAVAGRFESYKNTAYQLAVDSRWNDQWRTAFQYVRSAAGTCSISGAACSTAGFEGSKVLVGAAYYLSKRTYLFGAIDKMTNGDKAQFSSTASGRRPALGEDIRQIGLGISHAF